MCLREKKSPTANAFRSSAHSFFCLLGAQWASFEWKWSQIIIIPAWRLSLNLLAAEKSRSIGQAAGSGAELPIAEDARCIPYNVLKRTKLETIFILFSLSLVDANKIVTAQVGDQDMMQDTTIFNVLDFES